jgi:hypothetical protein
MNTYSYKHRIASDREAALFCNALSITNPNIVSSIARPTQKQCKHQLSAAWTAAESLMAGINHHRLVLTTSGVVAWVDKVQVSSRYAAASNNQVQHGVWGHRDL